MSDWTYGLNMSRCVCYPNGSSTYQTLINGGGSANTKGNWTELVASTPFSGYLGLRIISTAYVGDCLFDVGIGAESSEVVLVNNLFWTMISTTLYRTGGFYHIPKLIPSGSRISIKLQSSYAGTQQIAFACIVCGVGSFSSMRYFNKIFTYGANTSDSGGTSVDPGGSANTKGSYSVLSAGITHSLRGFFFSVGNQVNTASTTTAWHLDLAIGAAGSEVVIISDYAMALHANSDQIFPLVSPIFWVSVPYNTAISARASCEITDATDRKFDIILYGVA